MKVNKMIYIIPTTLSIIGFILSFVITPLAIPGVLICMLAGECNLFSFSDPSGFGQIIISFGNTIFYGIVGIIIVLIVLFIKMVWKLLSRNSQQ